MTQNVSPKIFSLLLPLMVFLSASLVWFLILAQIINFIFGLIILSFFVFIIFWRGFLINRKAGELFFLKNKKQILIISLALTFGFSELIWAISFLPFSFFILAGLFSVIFTTVFNILREYFKQRTGLFLEIDRNNFKKILIRDVFSGIIFIIIIIGISSWLPIKVH